MLLGERWKFASKFGVDVQHPCAMTAEATSPLRGSAKLARVWHSALRPAKTSLFAVSLAQRVAVTVGNSRPSAAYSTRVSIHCQPLHPSACPTGSERQSSFTIAPAQNDNMPHSESHSFSAPTSRHAFSALLFDMDGTIIDSTPAIVKYWMGLGEEIGVPGSTILETSHGRRSIDVLSILAPEKANWEFVCEAEGKVPKMYGQDAVEIPGSRAMLEQLEKAGAPWAIVTSGTRPLVTGWLDVMKLAHPKHLVTAEEVAKGKPDPAPYRLGAKRLGFDDGTGINGTANGAELKRVKPEDVVVFEDAPAGVRSGKAANYRVVALATTHAIPQLQEAGADWIVEDMRSVIVTNFDAKTGKVELEITNALVA